MKCEDQADGTKMCSAAGKNCETIISNYYNLTLRLNDTLAYHIPPTSYLQTVNGNCQNLIIFNPSTTEIILGDVFIENYYTIYNYEDTTIGFNGWVETGFDVEHQRPPRYSHTEFTVYIIVIGVLFLIGIVIALLLHCRNSKLQEGLDNENMISGDDQFITKSANNNRRQTYQDFVTE